MMTYQTVSQRFQAASNSAMVEGAAPALLCKPSDGSQDTAVTSAHAAIPVSQTQYPARREADQACRSLARGTAAGLSGSRAEPPHRIHQSGWARAWSKE